MCVRSSFERVRAYLECNLRELEAEFARDGNPVHAYEATWIARRYGLEATWAEDFVDDAIDQMLEILHEVADGKPTGREAERVGKALGFGRDGPGQRGWFRHATNRKRDRAIYFEVCDKLQDGIKLDAAYDEAAKAFDVSRSSVVQCLSAR